LHNRASYPASGTDLKTNDGKFAEPVSSARQINGSLEASSRASVHSFVARNK
jgi:hypothetical protein